MTAAHTPARFVLLSTSTKGNKPSVFHRWDSLSSDPTEWSKGLYHHPLLLFSGTSPPSPRCSWVSGETATRLKPRQERPRDRSASVRRPCRVRVYDTHC